MSKVINYNIGNKKIIITICLVSVLLIFSSYMYNQTYTIQYNYKGVKYQANNPNTGVPISIEIDGEYKRGYFGKADIFKGSIVIDGEMCYGLYGDKSRGKEYAFNEYKMSQIESDNLKGHFYINDMFKEITVEIHKPNTTGGGEFSYEDGWLISAPSQDRDKAVEISNKLIQRLHNNVKIK